MTARPQDVALLPCPFCGGDAELDTNQAFLALATGKLESSVSIYCTKCVVQMQHCYSDHPGVERDDLKNDLVERWNTRANVTAALASAQAREHELRVAEAETFDKYVDANEALIEDEVRAERLEEALRDGLSGLNGLFASGDYPLTDEVAELGLAIIEDMQAALSTNAATQTGERNEAAE